MSLSSQEAAASLSQAEQAGRRSSQYYYYHRSSPHLILWGIIWVLGYGGTGLAPQYSDPLWAVLILAGTIGGTIIGYHHHAAAGPRAWRMFALVAIILFFVFATYAILRPHEGRQLAAFPALITGTVYMAMGLWVGLRYVISGVAVVTLTLIGFYYIAPICLWMAVVGGGSMILAGLWFRTV